MQCFPFGIVMSMGGAASLHFICPYSLLDACTCTSKMHSLTRTHSSDSFCKPCPGSRSFMNPNNETSAAPGLLCATPS